MLHSLVSTKRHLTVPDPLIQTNTKQFLQETSVCLCMTKYTIIAKVHFALKEYRYTVQCYLRNTLIHSQLHV